MALIDSLLTLLALAAFCGGFACLGAGLLRRLGVALDDDAEFLLISVAVGVVVTEAALALAEWTQHFHAAAFVVLCALCLPVVTEGREVLRRARALARRLRPQSTFDRWIWRGLLLVLLVEFLMAMAPLSGSDAMHYHFTAQRLILERGFHPFFDNSHGFLCGQHHLLILLGLALGSEKLALGLIFLGGVLTAGALAALAARWASPRLVLVFTLFFLLMPVVFWQITVSGSPDSYMAFCVAALALLLSRPGAGDPRFAFIAGLLAGGVAGAKYTGCLIAAAGLLALIVEYRSALSAGAYVLGSLAAGLWPYLRNLIWTRNPVFPFLAAKLSPHLVTLHALANLASDTGASEPRHWSQLPAFFVFAAMRAKNPGFWDFFGPAVLVFAPLIVLAVRRTRPWRVVLLLWLVSALAIYLTSGLSRFLLPVFPLGLACAAAGVEWASQREWKLARYLSAAVLALFLAMGAGGLVAYGWQAAAAGAGILRSDAFLRAKTQDYQVVQAVNDLLGTVDDRGTALVFMRHLYYLRVPYLNGDPDSSFAVDPDALRTPEQWMEFFRAHGVVYVVRNPDFPPSIAAPLKALEARGELAPFRQKEVRNFNGMKQEQVEKSVSVVVLRVNPAAAQEIPK